jgi:iron complex transport system substrate-binding protein
MNPPDHAGPGTSRRQFVARSLGAVGAVSSLPLALSACGGNAESASTAKPGGPWTFKDDRGVEVTLPGRPKRIVAHEYAAVALWDYGIRPVGIYGSVALDKQPLMKDFDLTGIESVGEVWGEVNLEALAAARPDLIVSTYWPSEKLLGGIKDDKLEKKITAIAPIVGIHAQVPATTTIAHFESLAGSLGADLQGPELTAIRKRFEDAVSAFRAAAKQKPDLRVLAVATAPDALYVAKTEDYSDLREFEAWGLNVVSGKSSDPYWETLSWENADKYPADLILYDGRAHAPGLEELAQLPVWPRLPAVEAGQLSPWHMEEAVSYRLFAGHVEELTAKLQDSAPVT